jgi:hypothetical protein
MDLKELLAGHAADVKVEWEDEVVNVTYDKHAYTPELEAQVMDDANGGGRALADLLEKLLMDWDVLENGQPFPPTRANIGRLPIAFLVAVMKAIGESMAQDPTLSGTSEEAS